MAEEEVSSSSRSRRGQQAPAPGLLLVVVSVVRFTSRTRVLSGHAEPAHLGGEEEEASQLGVPSRCLGNAERGTSYVNGAVHVVLMADQVRDALEVLRNKRREVKKDRQALVLLTNSSSRATRTARAATRSAGGWVGGTGGGG